MNSVSFSVPGKVPSKSNYRFSRTLKGKEAWARIKKYENDVGMAAMAAGVKGNRGKARLKVLLINQTCDLDNSLKCPIDGLRGVAFKDDSPAYLEAVQVTWAKDDGPARVEYRIEWDANC